MLRKNPSRILPIDSESAFIDPAAFICGKVVTEEAIFISPYAVHSFVQGYKNLSNEF